MPDQKLTILVMESDGAVQAGLRRVRPADNVELVFTSLDAALALPTGSVAAVMADDQVLFGAGVTTPLEALKAHLQCPVILMTVFNSKRTRRSAMDQGIDVVLPKPFGLTGLRNALSQALSNRMVVAAGTAGDTGETAGEHKRHGEPNEEAALTNTINFEGRIAGEEAFDALFVELEKRQPLKDGLDSFDVVERHLIRRALEACGGNQSHAARFLGITRNTLRKRIHKYGFSALLTKDEDGKD